MLQTRLQPQCVGQRPEHTLCIEFHGVRGHAAGPCSVAYLKRALNWFMKTTATTQYNLYSPHSGLVRKWTWSQDSPDPKRRLHLHAVDGNIALSAEKWTQVQGAKPYRAVFQDLQQTALRRLIPARVRPQPTRLWNNCPIQHIQTCIACPPPTCQTTHSNHKNVCVCETFRIGFLGTCKLG
jgi:hypothetical protein